MLCDNLCHKTTIRPVIVMNIDSSNHCHERRTSEYWRL